MNRMQASYGFDVNSFLGIRVPRSRFLPVKTTSDLLLVMSDLYTVQHGSLMMNPSRGFMSVPLVKLGDMNFRKVCAFKNCPPSC